MQPMLVLFPPPSPHSFILSLRLSPFTFMSHHHHHHFRSTNEFRFHKWVRTCDIWPSELGLPLSMMISSSIHFSANAITPFFFMTELQHISYFLYPFIGCWAPQLIPQFGYWEQSRSKHGCAGICLYIDLHSFGYTPKSDVVWP
jgi:hypothetical protein